ncbi:DUF6149 family protein [Halobacterium noricense]
MFFRPASVPANVKLHQNAKHFASRKALELPGVRSVAKRGLVDLHVRIFSGKADEARREERRDHLEDFFDATMDMYLAALQEGYSEAEARETTHIVANFDFYNHGWAEMMEFPPSELTDHYERYAEFFDAHGISVDDPLGEFRPADGVAEAPATPERLDEADFEHAEGGYADDVYVETEDGEVQRGDVEEPDDVDPSKRPGT